MKGSKIEVVDEWAALLYLTFYRRMRKVSSSLSRWMKLGVSVDAVNRYPLERSDGGRGYRKRM